MMLDLRSFLDLYAREHPTDVKRISRPLSVAYEVTALISQLEQRGQDPLLVCDQVVGLDGTPYAAPVVSNLLGSRDRCARVLGADFANAGQEYARRVQSSLDPTVLPRADAPVQEVVVTGEQVDLTRLPALIHHDWDPGPYITGGFFTSYEPESGTDNCALQRGWVKGPREIRVFLAPNSHSKQNLRRHEQQGLDMPCAFWIGHHPLVILAGQARKGYPVSHFATMGGAVGTPLRLTPSVTLGDNFLVPADAEYVIEGYLSAGVRRPEGPFGEFTGYIGPQLANPVMTVTALTHRRQPIWYDIPVGYAENRIIGGLALEAAVHDLLRQKCPSVQRVYAPISGLCRYNVYVQLKDPLPGEAREAVLATLLAHTSVKHAFVVDEDVNIYDDRQILRAIATRSQWDRDLIVAPGLRGGILDPSAPTPHTRCKGGLDCTRAPEKILEERVVDSESVRLDDQATGGAAVEAVLRQLLREKIPSFRNVHMPVSGLARYHAYVQLHVPLPGEAREAILCALLAHPSIKHAFVFDTDVDIFLEQEVLWAIATRSQWDQDVVVLPRLRSTHQDPSSSVVDTCKGGLDCTRPPDRVFEERNRVPAEVLARMNPDIFLN